ncbi:MAG: hypothetical protein M1561_01730 [Gammaproteobacteria bacterium]|nr:hypothetical protein [Gammaproteobacteria bacterium]
MSARALTETVVEAKGFSGGFFQGSDYSIREDALFAKLVSLGFFTEGKEVDITGREIISFIATDLWKKCLRGQFPAAITDAQKAAFLDALMLGSNYDFDRSNKDYLDVAELPNFDERYDSKGFSYDAEKMQLMAIHVRRSHRRFAIPILCEKMLAAQQNLAAELNLRLHAQRIEEEKLQAKLKERTEENQKLSAQFCEAYNKWKEESAKDEDSPRTREAKEKQFSVEGSMLREFSLYKSLEREVNSSSAEVERLESLCRTVEDDIITLKTQIAAIKDAESKEKIRAAAAAERKLVFFPQNALCSRGGDQNPISPRRSQAASPPAARIEALQIESPSPPLPSSESKSNFDRKV